MKIYSPYWMMVRKRPVRTIFLFSFVLSLIGGPLQAAEVTRRDAVVMAVEKASPAVVNISTEVVREQRNPFSLGGRDPFFDQFFQDFFNSIGPREYKTSSQGSGVIISPEGYILTNEHVIDQASHIMVRLANQEEYPATLVGSDPKSDLAVLRIQPERPLPFIRMGRSDDLMIGETVIAIGNPFGLSHTVTTGVISALNRSIKTGKRVYKDFVQTDASINPGNSGGPLLNINGELIGINTAIYQKAEGIGFAIPINRAKRIYDDLVAFGEVHKPWLGIFVQDLTPQLAQYFGLTQSHGVLVSRVVHDGPGGQVGVQDGDIIIKIGPKEILDRESYLTFVEEYKAGASIPITLFRQGENLDLRIKSSEITFDMAMIISIEWLGLEVDEVQPERGRRDQRSGVVITKVIQNSESYKIGIRTGDIIGQVNNTRISSKNDYWKAIKQALNTENVVLLVIRENVGYYITLSP